MTGATASQVTVLLVEDEPAVRTVARLTLLHYGYVVLEAANGAEAVRVSEAHAGPVHLLLTHLGVPGKTGEDEVQAILSRHTATSPGEVPELGANAVPGSAFLPKPFTPTTLAAKVREVLAA